MDLHLVDLTSRRRTTITVEAHDTLRTLHGRAAEVLDTSQLWLEWEGEELPQDDRLVCESALGAGCELAVVETTEFRLRRQLKERNIDPDDTSAFLRAVKEGEQDIVKTFIALGTCTLVAVNCVGFGQGEMLRLILDALRLNEDSLRWYLSRAVQRNDFEIASTFLDYGCIPKGYCCRSIVADAVPGSVPLAKKLVIAGANVNCEGLLSKAVRTRDVSLVALLLKAGASPAAEGALTEAAGNGDLEICKHLVKAGANVHGCVCVICASNIAVANRAGHHAIAEYLKSRGAKEVYRFPNPPHYFRWEKVETVAEYMREMMLSQGKRVCDKCSEIEATQWICPDSTCEDLYESKKSLWRSKWPRKGRSRRSCRTN